MTTPLPAPKLPTARLFAFASIGLPLGALSIAVSVYLPAHLASHLGLSMTMIGSCWATVRIIDLFVDPVLGLAMDRTRTRIGRYRPWIVLGAPILIAALWGLFEAPQGIGAVYLICWLLTLYLGQSMLTMGQSAWAAGLAPDYHGRSRAFGAIGVATVLGGVAVILIPVLAAPLGLSSAGAVQAMGWFIMGLAPCVVVIAALATPERLGAKPPPFRLGDVWALVAKPDLIRLFLAQLSLTLGPGWMSALYLFFFTSSRGFSTGQASILLLLYIVAGVFGAWLISRLAMRLGKHRALMLVASAFALGVLATPFTPKGSLLAVAPILAWTGFMAAGFDVTIRAMLADVGDEIRLEHGTEQLSLIYAMNALANKLAAAFAIGLTFPLLSAIGFDPTEGAVNTAASLRGLELAFIGGPIVFVLLGAVCVTGWRLDARRHEEVRRDLLLRDGLAMQGAALSEAPLLPSTDSRP